MPESTEALIGVNAAVLAVVFSARSGHSLCIESSPTVFPSSMSKRVHPAFMEFTRQGQHLACIPRPNSPLKQATVLVEFNNVPQPYLTR